MLPLSLTPNEQSFSDWAPGGLQYTLDSSTANSYGVSIDVRVMSIGTSCNSLLLNFFLFWDPKDFLPKFS